MWCCCCPKVEEEEPNSKSLKEDLVQKVHKNQPQIEVTQGRYEEQKQPQSQPQQIKDKQPVNPHLQKMREIQTSQPVRLQEVLEDIPREEPRTPFRSLLKSGNNEQSEKIKKRSDLWSQQSGSKILYMNSQKDEQMIFTFKINKVKLEQNHPMNFILQPIRYGNPNNKIRTKSVDLMVCLIISTKSLSKLQTSIAKITNQGNVKLIFGLLKKEDEEKLSRNYFQSETIQEIIVIGKGCLRFECIDKIIISLRDEKDFNSILNLSQKITQHFELEDIAKVTFIFPAFLTLSEICYILSRLLRKFMISQKLQRIVKYLGYHIEMVQTITEQFQQVIIVSTNLNINQADQIPHKQFEVKLQLALGLLMIEIDYNTFKIYQSLISNFLADKTITDYLKFIQFVHKDKKEFLNKLQELKIFDQSQLIEIDKSNKIDEKIVSPTEKMIVIKHRNKRKIGDLFREYRTTKTPVQQFDKKKEWDDDLREHDIKATIMDKNNRANPNNKHIDNNCNIFEVIDEDYVEQTDLALLPNEEDDLIFQDDEV